MPACRADPAGHFNDEGAAIVAAGVVGSIPKDRTIMDAVWIFAPVGSPTFYVQMIVLFGCSLPFIGLVIARLYDRFKKKVS
jgi:hypothetical protein